MVKVAKGKKCEGIFIGLVVGRQNKNGGLWPAIEKGECQVIKYVVNSKVPALLQLEADVVNAFIQANMLKEKKRPLLREAIKNRGLTYKFGRQLSSLSASSSILLLTCSLFSSSSSVILATARSSVTNSASDTLENIPESSVLFKLITSC